MDLTYGLLIKQHQSLLEIMPPVWIPVLDRRGTSGMCGMMKVVTALRQNKATLQTSEACLYPLRIGRPLATTYASPIVSTCLTQSIIYVSIALVTSSIVSTWLTQSNINVSIALVTSSIVSTCLTQINIHMSQLRQWRPQSFQYASHACKSHDKSDD